MSDDKFPAGITGSQSLFQPLHLRVIIIAGKESSYPAVLGNNRGSVEKEEMRRGSIAEPFALPIEGAGHGPAGADLRISHLSHRIAFVVVVSQRGVPRAHQGRCGIDILEDILPQRIARAGNAFTVEVVAGRNYKEDVVSLSNLCHRIRDLALGDVLVSPVAYGEEGKIRWSGRRMRDLARHEASQRRCRARLQERAPGDERSICNHYSLARVDAGSCSTSLAGRIIVSQIAFWHLD